LIFLRRACRGASIVTLLAVAQGPTLVQSQPAASQRTDAASRTPNQPVIQPPVEITVVAPEPSPEDAKREEQYRQREVVAQEDVRDFSRWLTYLTFIQAGIGLIALLLTGKAAKASTVAANAARVSAIEAGRQAGLMRQQMVATFGAVIHINVNINPIGHLNVHFGNIKQGTAKNLEATITITRVMAPSLTPIDVPIIELLREPHVVGESGAVGFSRDLDPSWLPLTTDRQDNWADFVANPRTVRVDVTFAYDNGFGDRVAGKDFSGVYMAKWSTRQTKNQTGGGGGGLTTAEHVAHAWDHVNSAKKREAETGYSGLGV
jgi:hypothetical protein